MAIRNVSGVAPKAAQTPQTAQKSTTKPHEAQKAKPVEVPKKPVQTPQLPKNCRWVTPNVMECLEKIPLDFKPLDMERAIKIIRELDGRRGNRLTPFSLNPRLLNNI